MKRIQFKMDVWQELFAIEENKRHIFTFTLETEQTDTHVHSRMFAPAMGISEDPATGGASGPLGYYLVEQKLVKSQNESYSIVSEQGMEMGRPSRIEISINMKAGLIQEVKVGGSALIMGEGTLSIPDSFYAKEVETKDNRL
jgi:trans-2,3-dihydro-3-hydroxyanthranilate isomerase